MALSMRERQAITREMARRYVRAGKRERGLMLDELCALTGYMGLPRCDRHSHYAA